MKDKQYSTCVSESQNYTDRDAYISDISLSSMLGDLPDAEIPEDRIEQLGSIYDAANRSIKDIAAAAGLSNRKLAERFCIPYRTMENWCAGVSDCPIYTRLMMQQCLGLYDPPTK